MPIRKTNRVHQQVYNTPTNIDRIHKLISSTKKPITIIY